MALGIFWKMSLPEIDDHKEKIMRRRRKQHFHKSTFSLKEAETSGRDIEVHPIKAIKEDYVLRRYGKNVKMPTSPARKHRG